MHVYQKSKRTRLIVVISIRSSKRELETKIMLLLSKCVLKKNYVFRTFSSCFFNTKCCLKRTSVSPIASLRRFRFASNQNQCKNNKKSDKNQYSQDHDA